MKRILCSYRLLLLSCFFLNNLDAASLTLSTYNLRNFGTASAPSPGEQPVSTHSWTFVKTLKANNFDLMAVQEVVNVTLLKNIIKKQFPHLNLVLSKCGGKGSQKLGFIYNPSRLALLSFKEDFIVKEQKHCSEGLRPIVVATFKDKVNYETFRVIGVHLKAGGADRDVEVRAKQLYRLQNAIVKYRKSSNQNYPLITLGDFNTTDFKFDPYMNKSFHNLVRRSETFDVTQALECTSYWWGGENDGKEHPSHLDHILIDSNWLNQWSNFKIKAGAHCEKLRCRKTPYQDMGETFSKLSDHCPISVTLVE